MDFKQLQSFVTAVKHRSFSIAAEELGISQPTISIHIKNLEEELDTKLVIRTAKSFQVTPRGQEFYECIQNVIKLKEDLINRWNGQALKVIHMGVSAIPSTHILPEVLPKFRNLYEDVYFNVTQNVSRDIIEAVQKGSYDIGLVGMKPDSELLEFQEFYHDRMVVITPNNECCQKLKNVEGDPLEYLLKGPMILREPGSGSGKSTDLLLEKIGIQKEKLCVVARMNDQESIKNLVAGGLGISIISQKAVEDYLEAKKILTFDLPEEYSKRTYYIIYQKDYILKPYVKDFIEFLTKHYEKKE